MASLDNFNGAAAGKYDPGYMTIFFDNRQSGPPASEDKMSYSQSYSLAGLYRLGWPSWQTPDLEPGKLRLVWYTHAGTEGSRDYPLWNAYVIKEMFESLSSEGFRPMLYGWSNENPFPEIGGHEPPPKPKKIVPRAASSVSGTYSGHGGKLGGTPHDRVMAIIEKEEEREAKKKREQFELAHKADDLAV